MKQKVRLNSTKNKLLSILLALCTVLVLPAGFSSQAALFPEFRDPINYGRGTFSAEVQGVAVCYDSAGNAEFCYGVQGGWFYVINPADGQVKLREWIPGTTMLHSLITGSDGNVYFNNYPEDHLKMYNPKTKEIVSLDGFDRNGATVRSQYAQGDSIYFGAYHPEGSRVFEYDIHTNTTKDYGVMKEGAHYIQGMAADETYIYAGLGCSSEDSPNIHAVVRCNKETGEKTELVGARSGISVFRDMEVTEDKLFVYVNGGTLVYDKETGEELKLFNSTAPQSSVHPQDSSKIYYLWQTHIYEVGTASLTSTYGTNLMESADELNGLKWAKVNGEWVLEFHTPFFSYVGYYHPETKKTTVNLVSDIPEEDAGPTIQGFEMMDDILYIGGYQTSMAAYDTIEEKFIYKIPNWTQNEGTGFMNGKVYFGTYTDAVMYRYDPKEPINYVPYNYDGEYQGASNNPTMVYDIEEHQDRPFVVKSYENKLYIGTTSAYSVLGGALTIYEEDADGNPSAQVYKDIIPKQSITGIAVKDNLVYISGTIRGGLGITPTETQAKMAVFNTTTNQIEVAPFVPELPIVGTTSLSIGDLSFGPDGLLWGAAEQEGLVFAMNPETFKVEKYVATRPGDNRGAYCRPLYLRWGDDGFLYTSAGQQLSVINPDTMQYKKLLDQGVSLMTLDSEGNIWYTRGSFDFYKLPRVLEEDAIHSRVDYAKQQIVVSGTLLKNNTNTLKIVAPNGTVVMVDEFETKASQKFIKKYVVDPLQNGTYTVYLNNKNMKTSYVCALEVEAPVNILRAESELTVGDSVQGTASISNFYAASKTVQVMIAGYQNVNGKENMVCAERTTQSIQPGAYEMLELSMDKNSKADTYRIFVWDENLNPIIASKTVR